jgi:hypothetical protein
LRTEGHQIFVDALTQFAEQSRNSRLTPIIGRISAPLRVAVHWRRCSGPVDALHRSCGADIGRGSLRLLGQVR